MNQRFKTKRIAALVLTFAMVVLLFPMGIMVQAEQTTVKPFYTVNWSALQSECDYVYDMPYFWTNGSAIGEDTTDISVYVPAYGTEDLETIAQKMKEDLNARPDGARYINFSAMTDVFRATVQDVVFMDRGVELVSKWMNEFLAAYYAIGGKLDGIAVDLEYHQGTSFYIQDDEYADYANNNKNIYNEIVANPYYQTRMRPKLVERGFEFYENPNVEQYPYRSEIWTMYRYDSSGGKAKCRNIWDDAYYELMAEYINEAVYEPLQTYYPGASLSDYHTMDAYGWMKHVSDSGSVAVGSSVKAGDSSNYNATYAARPGSSFYKYTTDTATGSTIRSLYQKPPSFNAAVYEPTPFNMALWDVNLFKRMLASTETGEPGKVSAWITSYNYGASTRGTISNTPYYSEIILHLGLMDPQPFLGYVLQGSTTSASYNYKLQVINELMAELTRVAGASDREPLIVPDTWNGSYILSGMYAGGRNIWRLTPDTTKISLEDFKVEGKAPTFSVDGLTITFPQGRIIEDGEISEVGTSGYWIETPADVTPVITSTADRYSENPSFAETFESYEVGTFTTATVYPNTYWTVTGTAAILEESGNKALALTGDASLTNTKLPQNITAGDDYAKQQAWEITFTLPEGLNADAALTLLSCADSDGIKISGGNVYYYDKDGNELQLSGVSLTAGTYTVKREVDFRTTGAYTSSYAIYHADGTLLGSVSNASMAAVTLPVSTISTSCTGVSGNVLIDDYKLYPTGVTTVFELYDAEFGYELTDTATARTENTAYRLSWMNASGEQKVVRVYNSTTGETVRTVEMAPGMDGVFTGIVEASADNAVTLAVEVQAGTSPTYPDYDNGNFDWPTYAENLGVSCIVGNAGYTTLEAAVAAAESGQTVILLADVQINAPIIMNKAISIDGNGQTVSVGESFAGTYVFSITAGGELTLDENLTVNAGNRTALLVSGGNLNVNGCAIIAENGTAIMLSQDADKTAISVNVTGGSLSGEKAFYQCNTNSTPSENISAVISGTVITGTLEAAEEHFVMLSDEDGYYLHGHTIAVDAAVAPTCTETGLTEGSHYACCDTILVPQEVIPALGHASWTEADCDTAKTCTVCGATEGEPLGHSWSNATCTVPKTCSVCAATEGEPLGHSWNEATCTTPKTCSVCNVTESETAGHQYETEIVTTGYITYTCTVCGDQYDLVAPQASLYYLPLGGNSQVGSSYRIQMNQGADPVYFTVSQADANNPDNWYTVKVTDGSVPTDNYVKLDYSGTVPTLTLKNVTIKNILGLSLGGSYRVNSATTTHTTPYRVVLIGNNTIETTGTNYGGLNFVTTGDVTVTGEGTLTLTSNKYIGSSTAVGGVLASCGDIIIDNTNVNIVLPETYGKAHAIASYGGDIIVKGGNLTVNGYDDPSTDTSTTRGEAIYAAFYAIKDANDEGGNLIIRDGANVTVIASPYQCKAVQTVTFTVADSDVVIGIAGKDYNGYVFSTAPVLDFTDAYTAMASANMAAWTAEDGLTAPAATVNYAAADATTYRYFRVYRNCVAPESHSYVPVVTAPTCTAKGYTTYTCTGCGISYVADYVDVIAHSGGEIQVENVVAATCTADGSYDNVTYCTVCNAELTRQTVTVAAVGHQYTSAVTAPTCTAQGYTTYTCTGCGHSYVADYVDAATHTAGEVEELERVSATTTADGYYVMGTKCTVCGTVCSSETIVLPATTQASLYYLPLGGNSQVGSSYRIQMNHGAAPVYFTVSQADANNPDNWYTVKVTDGSVPTDNYVKLDYTGDVATLTLKNVNIKNILGLTLGGNYKPYAQTTTTVSHSTHYNVVLIGDNTIETTGTTYGALDFITTGDVTISGEGTLTLISNKNNTASGNYGGVMTSYGNIIFDNANVNIVLPEISGKAHAIAAIGGDITVKGGNLTINGYDDPSTMHAEGATSGYARNGEAMYSAFYTVKNADNAGGDLTICDGANVTVIASPYQCKVVQADTFTIADSDVAIGVAGKDHSGYVFSVAPTLEFTGAYIATASTGMATWTAEDGLAAPAETVTYAAADAATYRYFRVVRTA